MFTDRDMQDLALAAQEREAERELVAEALDHFDRGMHLPIDVAAICERLAAIKARRAALAGEGEGGRGDVSDIRVIHVREMQPGDIYVGRWMPRQKLPGSIWGNPFKIGRDGTREEVLEKYRAHVLTITGLSSFLREIRGKRLACWCAPAGGITASDPLICHGQILAALAAGSRPEGDDATR